MGFNLIHALKDAKVTRLLNLGSSCMYPRNCEGAIPESKMLTGELEPTNEGYAIAKIAVAKLAEYISKEQTEFRFKTLIPCNLYGRFDKFDAARSHLVPSILVKIRDAIKQNQKEVEIWGDGEARREFMYAGDFANYVFDLVARFDDVPPYLNVGLGYDYSINEYYQTAAKVMGFSGRFFHNLDKPVGMKRKLVDITQLNAIGVKHDSGLESGLTNTLQFLKVLE
jgi:GDP-L-fucose synthase